MKLAASNNLVSVGLVTSPTTSQILIPASKLIYLNGSPWTCTQMVILSKLISCKGLSPSYRCMTTRCLSKLHGSLLRILSTSFLLSNVNRILWSPNFWILKPFLSLHSGVNVLAMISTLVALLIKNFVEMEKSLTLLSCATTPRPFSLREGKQILGMSQIIYSLLHLNYFPIPWKRTQQYHACITCDWVSELKKSVFLVFQNYAENFLHNFVLDLLFNKPCVHWLIYKIYCLVWFEEATFIFVFFSVPCAFVQCYVYWSWNQPFVLSLSS